MVGWREMCIFAGENRMEKIRLHIVGLTHHDVAGRREEFVRTAAQRAVVIRPAKLHVDGGTLEAFVGAECVGVVTTLDLSLG